MRKLLLTVLCAACLSSCANLPPINWPKLIHCTPGVSDLINVVTLILVADDQDDSRLTACGARELAELALRRGPEAVVCIVERLVEDWTAPTGPPEPKRLAAAARGRHFLKDVGTEAHIVPEGGGP
jgi:hypothetical protein